MLTVVERLRRHVSHYAAVYAASGAFFFTVVLGNILYAFPFASDWPSASIPHFSWETFPIPPGWQLWVLLIAPIVGWAVTGHVTSKIATPLATQVEPFIPEIPLPVYVILCIGSLAYVAYTFYEVGAIGLLISPRTQVEAIQARFMLLGAMGMKPNIVLKSILVFLTVYGITRSIRGGPAWRLATAATATATSIFMVLLNAKWPIVLFIVTLALTTFVVSKKHALIKSSTVALIGVVTYLMISTLLLRFVPTSQVASGGAGSTIGFATELASSSATSAPTHFVAALNRMAMNVIYYVNYKEFVTDCEQGARHLWIDRPLICEPSLRVYAQMFGNDGFTGIGTAPAAGPIYWYALAGWGGSILALLLTGLVLGLFAALWRGAQTNCIYMTAVVMGGHTGYFFSQLPPEGPLIYDHGMLWWVALVFFWLASYWAIRLLGASAQILGIRAN